MPLLNETDATALDALRARQGAGARYDAAAAPHDDLLLARRGAAFFARILNNLTDEDLDGPSLRMGLSRRHIVSEISLHARAMALAIKAARVGPSEEETNWLPDPALTVTLPTRALRSLYMHSDVHLNVEFRDLTSEQWDATIETEEQMISIRNLPVRRGRDLWLGAVDLNATAQAAAIPEQFRAKSR